MFLDRDRYLYQKAQLVEVICQLRFPAILKISTQEPAEFQELIRKDFPQYQKLAERPQPRLTGVPGNFRVEEGESIVNYQFLSADGKWKVNLTNSFISLATPAYTRWEDFAAKLDLILSQFISTYEPAFFERVGLRYVNIFSRKALDLQGVPFRDLFQPGYLGLLAEDDVREESFGRSGQDIEMALSGGCRLKMHAGPGMLQRGQVKDEEVKFILDNDVYMPGKLPVNQCAPALQTVHIQADRIFAGA
ncbi:MAG: TIGR04255 family protein, partial [Oscillospiraceae bacterium]|nr:TIGR04255 family protein [Oscillospiraceae bacterium]